MREKERRERGTGETNDGDRLRIERERERERETETAVYAVSSIYLRSLRDDLCPNKKPGTNCAMLRSWCPVSYCHEDVHSAIAFAAILISVFQSFFSLLRLLTFCLHFWCPIIYVCPWMWSIVSEINPVDFERCEEYITVVRTLAIVSVSYTVSLIQNFNHGLLSPRGNAKGPVGYRSVHIGRTVRGAAVELHKLRRRRPFCSSYPAAWVLMIINKKQCAWRHDKPRPSLPQHLARRRADST